MTPLTPEEVERGRAKVRAARHGAEEASPEVDSRSFADLRDEATTALEGVTETPRRRKLLIRFIEDLND